MQWMESMKQPTPKTVSSVSINSNLRHLDAISRHSGNTVIPSKQIKHNTDLNKTKDDEKQCALCDTGPASAVCY